MALVGTDETNETRASKDSDGYKQGSSSDRVSAVPAARSAEQSPFRRRQPRLRLPLPDIMGSAYGDGLVKLGLVKLGCGDRGARGAPIMCPVSEVLWPKAGTGRDHPEAAGGGPCRRSRASRFLGDKST